MKKTEIKNTLEALIKDEVSPETLAEVMKIIDQMGKRATSNAKPKEIEVDGKTYKYCNRHGQYEPIEWFGTNAKGNINPECMAATLKWQQYGKEINKAIKDGDAVKLGELTLLRKKGGYDLKKDAKEFKDKLEELGIKVDTKDIIKSDDVK